MDNNWHEGSRNGASYSSSGGYDSNKKRKGGVTIGQLLICLLVVALISGGAGAYLANYITSRNALPPAESSMIVDDPGPSPEAAAPAAEQAAEQPGQSASDKFTIAPAAADDEGSPNIVQNCMATVVGIYTSGSMSSYSQYDPFSSGRPSGEEQDEQEDAAAGSGVILTEDGYIVTNNHVVSSLPSIFVYLQDGSRYEAELIGADTYSDLAIIKIDASGLPTAMLGNSESATVGDTVYAIGNPLGLTGSVSRGIVSGLNRTIDLDGISMTLMQTDAAVNPGNSGGGLFSANGELIGIVNAKSSSVSVEGLGYAIPIDAAQPVMADLMDRGYVTGRPYIGISMQEVSLRYGGGDNPYNPFNFYFNANYVTRVQIMSVEEGGTAEAGGMRVNDIVIALDGEEINGSSEFQSKLYEYNVGDVVTITVLRGNESIDLNITLGERS